MPRGGRAEDDVAAPTLGEHPEETQRADDVVLVVVVGPLHRVWHDGQGGAVYREVYVGVLVKNLAYRLGVGDVSLVEGAPLGELLVSVHQ